MWDPMGHPNRVVRQQIEQAVAAADLSPGARVLDFGCGVQPYRDVFGTEVRYIGADLPGNELADIHIDEGTTDLADGSIDLVMSTQVLEHVPDPHAYLVECRRVLRPGGGLILTTHGSMFFHPHPTDYWRWTAQGLDRVVADAGLSVESVTPRIGAVPLGLWLIMMNIQVKLPRGIRHAFVALANVMIRLTDRVSWSTYQTDFMYMAVARRGDPKPMR